MNTPANNPRRIRLQFSLRMILALMAVIGVALTLYRWPWVETKSLVAPKMPFIVVHADDTVEMLTQEPFPYERRKTYRRNWRGEGVKHGPDEHWRGDQLWQIAHYYDSQLNGQQRIFNLSGDPIIEAHYRNGKLHGPYRAGSGTTWIWEGTYDAGKRHGRWRALVTGASHEWIGGIEPEMYFDRQTATPREWMQFEAPPAPAIVQECNYHLGKRQGLMTWKTAAGELVSSAEYGEDELTSWNGEPICEQLRRWLASPEVNDPQLAALLFGDCELVQFGIHNRLPQGILTDDLRLTIQLRGQTPVPLVIHIERAGIPGKIGDSADPKSPFGPRLCERVAFHGYGFQYRYGGLWLVPRADPEPPFIDPTGVAQIKFPRGSRQAREWDEVIDIQDTDENEAGCVEQLLAGTSISPEIHLSDRPAKFEPPDLGPTTKTVFRRSRRNAIGYVLYRSGCRCELRSGRLVILPGDRRTPEQYNARPLALYRYPF